MMGMSFFFLPCGDVAVEKKNRLSLKHECKCTGQSMTAVALSRDGSLVAVAVAGSVTLWDPSANALVAVLPHPAPASGCSMQRLDFIADTPFLVSIYRSYLIRALSCSLCWAMCRGPCAGILLCPKIARPTAKSIRSYLSKSIVFALLWLICESSLDVYRWERLRERLLPWWSGIC